MKLILCASCHDVFKLNRIARTCKCAECGGWYKEDGLHAVYWGEHAIPLGFANTSLTRAIENQPEKGMGEVFEAFVIPKTCPTMEKRDTIPTWRHGIRRE